MTNQPAAGGGRRVDLSVPKNLDTIPLRYTVPPKEKSERVARWQRILKAKGFYTGKVDGVYGQSTLNATRSAARKAKAGFVGTITPGLWKAVAAAPAAPKPKPIPVDVNVVGVAWLEANVGPKEQFGKNDGPWLRVQLADGGDTDVWFAKSAHAPYCARIGVDEAYEEAGVDLLRLFPKTNWNFCPSIEACIQACTHSVDGKWRWLPVTKTQARRGDVMLHGNGVAHHVSRASEAAHDGVCTTTGANTPPGLSGDQAGLGSGDGIWTKTYRLDTFRACGRLTPVT